MKSRTFQIILRILSRIHRVYLETNSVVNASTYGTGSRSAIGERSGTTVVHYKLPLIHATMLGTNCLATTMKLPFSNIGTIFFPKHETLRIFFFLFSNTISIERKSVLEIGKIAQVSQLEWTNPDTWYFPILN